MNKSAKKIGYLTSFV